MIFGARATLGMIAGSLMISALVGSTFGLIAGLAPTWVDLLFSRLADVVLSFPPIILGLVITGILGPGIGNLVLALSIVMCPSFCGFPRSALCRSSCKKCTYVEAARALGSSRPALLRRHILLNILPLIFAQYIILFPLALQIEAALGFLGLGVQPPTPDWGASLNESKDYLLFAPWLALFPGLSLALSALTMMLLGRGIQRAMEVH